MRIFATCAPVAVAWALLMVAPQFAAAQCAAYTITQSTGTIVPGTTDIGNHCDDCLTAITLLFPVSFYGTSYTSASVSSNGNLQFGAPSGSYPPAYTNECLPSPSQITGPALFPFWDDLYTGATANGQIVLTSTTGSSPNRIFNIEFRANYCCVAAAPNCNFEIRLFEGSSGFDFVYGAVADRASATIGVQQAGGAGAHSTQFECNASQSLQGVRLHFDCGMGACCLIDGSCQVITRGACDSQGGLYGGDNSTCSTNCQQPGACCLHNGTCALTSSASCASQGGAYTGDGVTCAAAACPPGGACCDTSGGCQVLTQALCVAGAGRTYQGDGTACGVSTCALNPTGVGNANPNTVYQTSNTLLTVAVTPAGNPPSTGLAVTADLSSVAGNANQTLYDDGTHGDMTAGNLVFSLLYNMPASAPLGSASIPFTVSDAQGRSSTGTILLTVAPPCAGPDVTVFDLIDMANFATIGQITAYAIGTNACNPGCAPVSWVSSTNQHPVVAQNLYRLMNGRFEQVGQSWLKHTSASTNSGGCGNCVQPPNGSAQLGVGCTDAYNSGLNGVQGLLGPRSQVNSTTGNFPYPFSAPPWSTAIDRRLQCFTTDVTAAQNPGARYFAECHYVASDDATSNNGLNNATYREVAAGTLLSSNPSFAAGSHWRSPAIQAWRDADATVTLVAAGYSDAGITAQFWVAAKATDNGNGTWHYEYAIQNLNSDRSAGSFTVPLGRGSATSNAGFHAPFSHSGEPYSNAAWTISSSAGAITFATDAYAVNNNANALRWGTLYNFRFDAAAAPVTGSATLGLFKPGSPSSLMVAGIPVPGSACTGSPSGDMNADGQTDGQDIQRFVAAVLSSSTAATDICPGDFNLNGSMDSGDIGPFAAALLGL